MAHWYDRQGNSCHTIIGKNGKKRSTTLRDARSLKLAPSVTSIQSVLAAPGLEVWLKNELLDAAIENPWHPENGRSEKVYKSKMLAKMKEKGEKAAKIGTEVHNMLEEYFKRHYNSSFDELLKKDSLGNVRLNKYITQAVELIEAVFPGRKWVAEKSFYHQSGFGGCVDLYSAGCNNKLPIIIDFKTKDKKELEGVEQYANHKIQLAAYQKGLGLNEYTLRYNLFISVHADSPGFCKLVECTEYNKWIDVFMNLLNVWKVLNNYDPSNW